MLQVKMIADHRQLAPIVSTYMSSIIDNSRISQGSIRGTRLEKPRT